MTTTNDLYNHIYDKYSQRGHDGIIEKILKELSIDKGYFVEFGAWNGIFLSNCRKLYENGWKGCFIEGDVNKYIELCNNYKDDDNVLCINKFVYPTKEEDETNGDTIDNIYMKYISKFTNEIDIMSIDIDGRDYEIFENMLIKPKLIIIEGGFSWHPRMQNKIPYNIAANNIQQPLQVMIDLGRSKGYQPICFNQDTFLLRNDLYDNHSYFKKLDNDCVTLWNEGYTKVLNIEDRKWLNNYRKSNVNIRHFEKDIFNLPFR